MIPPCSEVFTYSIARRFSFYIWPRGTTYGLVAQQARCVYWIAVSGTGITCGVRVPLKLVLTSIRLYSMMGGRPAMVRWEAWLTTSVNVASRRSLTL